MATGDGATHNDYTGVSLENEGDIANAFEQFWKEQDALDNNETPSGKSDEGKKKTPAPAEEEEVDEDVSEDEAEDETEDADEPSEDDEGDEGETDDEQDEGDEPAGDKKKKFTDDDEVYTKVKVGDQEHEVSVKELKRLYGQEKALTQRSQEVAAKTKLAEENSAKALATIDIMVKRAAEAAAPYKNINWAALMKDPNISAEEVQGLQAMAKAATDNEAFLTHHMDGLVQHIRAEAQKAHREASAAALKSLTTEGSPNYIKGWNNQLYNDIRQFAVTQGMDAGIVNQLNDPAAFKMMHMAMQFHKGSKKVVATNKTNKSPKKIVKASTTNGTPDKRASQMVTRKDAVRKQAKAGGTMDATIDAFAALLGGDK